MIKTEIEIITTNDTSECILANQYSWNKKVLFDIKSHYYGVEDFKKGKSSLHNLELTLLGPIECKKLLHLQCYFGLDTMSFSRLGAEATGVDFCDNAIEYAKELTSELKLPTIFVESNIYNLHETIHETYDLIYSSYGSICWLPDLDVWASHICTLLKPGGSFFLIDFHPLVISLDLLKNEIPKYSYFNSENNLIKIIRYGTYADDRADIDTIEYNWNHSIGEILDVFIKRGFSIDIFKEYPFIPMNGFPNLEKGKDGYYYFKGENKYPLLFALKVTKH